MFKETGLRSLLGAFSSKKDIRLSHFFNIYVKDILNANTKTNSISSISAFCINRVHSFVFFFPLQKLLKLCKFWFLVRTWFRSEQRSLYEGLSSIEALHSGDPQLTAGLEQVTSTLWPSVYLSRESRCYTGCLGPIILQFEEKHFWMDPIKMDYVISEYCSLHAFGHLKWWKGAVRLEKTQVTSRPGSGSISAIWYSWCPQSPRKAFLAF